MKKKILSLLATAPFFVLLFLPPVYGAEKNEGEKTGGILPVEEFIRLCARNDRVFDEILIDQLKLSYQKELRLPPGDIILAAKAQYDFFLSRDRLEPETAISLSRLFPYTGTDVSVSYMRTPSIKSLTPVSEIQFLISQPVARNAFGSTTRIKDKIIGIEIEIARFQIVEAYEDYMASLLSLYYDWYSAYENLRVGETSYNENLKLQKNINDRRRQKIALPVDVNKVELLILGRKEDLTALRDRYKNLTNIVKKAVRYDSDTETAPADPSGYFSMELEFDREYSEFKRGSRTYKTLSLLERYSSLEVEKSAADLLPSTNLMAGYRLEGEDWQIKNEDRVFFAGVSLEWPLPDRAGRAGHEIAKVEHRKTALSAENKYLELQVNLKNIHLAAVREKELVRLAEEKIRLSGEVLRDEAENYSFGKITLNDYIDAVNRLDQNRFSRIAHLVQLKKLIVEWLRLTDKLVDETVLKKKSGEK